MTTSAAHGRNPIQVPGPVEMAPAPALGHKPGFSPLPEPTKGAFVGGATAICGAALQSRYFYLGFAFAMMLVVGGIVINRPHRGGRFISSTHYDFQFLDSFSPN